MPWIALDCAFGEHPKIASLPSDAARYGWVLTLLAAKRQTRPGRFASRRHYTEVMHRHAKHLSHYIAAGLLEVHEDGALVVHDWERYQWAAAKARQREDIPRTFERQTRDKNETDIDRDIDIDKYRGGNTPLVPPTRGGGLTPIRTVLEEKGLLPVKEEAG